MAIFDIAQTSTTNMESNVSNYSVNAQTIDSVDEYQKETYYDFPKANEYLGYYKTIPELKKAVDALAMWAIGKGFEADLRTKNNLSLITGFGEDSFQSILWNLLVQKKVYGDAFAEIIRDKDVIINLKPLNPADMRVVCNRQGIIIRYEHRRKGIKTEFSPAEILHLCNDRIADEIHGTSVIEACKWVIDARNEAMTDYRKVLHRNVVPVRIIEIDTDDTTKRDQMIREYEEAINKGEVLVIPKGTAEVKDTTISIQDPTSWIQYLENFFYQAVGIPKIILGGSQEFTEASSKIGYLTFEQVYMSEQQELEADIFSQLGLTIKFNRPISLKDNLQNDEAANTGQTGFQAKEASVNMERE